jgi:hypothetical protein
MENISAGFPRHGIRQPPDHTVEKDSSAVFPTENTARRSRNQNESELMKRSGNKQENRKHRKTSK